LSSNKVFLFRKLAKGDEIFSIEKESSDEQENQFIPVSTSVSSTQPQKKSITESTFGSGGAFRPIHEKPMSEYRGFPTITSQHNQLQSVPSSHQLAEEEEQTERTFLHKGLEVTSKKSKLRKRRASDSDVSFFKEFAFLLLRESDQLPRVSAEKATQHYF
jgi:hypothetical protein